MRIFIDADSFNSKLRAIISKRCEKEKIDLIFCANIPLPEQDDAYGKYLVITDEIVDDFITRESHEGDWVMTRDLLLAKVLLEKGTRVFNDRGREFLKKEIDQRLRERDLMQALRGAGHFPRRGKSFGQKEIQEFAQLFDQEITNFKKTH